MCLIFMVDSSTNPSSSNTNDTRSGGASDAQIHWHEGLFLQPHHFQYFQRQVSSHIATERHLAWAFPYGVVEASLSGDALENMLVRFERLRVIMPSGLEVAFPDNADLPALDIKRRFESSAGSLTVCLAVPLWYPTRGNTIQTAGEDDWQVKRIYRVAEVEQADENTGENTRPLQVRRLNARLVFHDDDHTDIEVLPLMRIIHATGEDVGMPKQDPAFIPPCLVLNGSPTLRDLVRDLAFQVEASRKELVVQITRGGFSVDTMRGVQFEQMMRLRTLNRYSARLPSLVAASGVSPFEMYLELRELLGELAALHPDRDQFDIAKYDHDNPAIVFNELSSKVRSLLRGAVAPSFMKVVFTKEDKNFVAALTDDQLTKPNEYFLGVNTKEDPRALAKLVEDGDKFKLMAKSKIEGRIFGIKLVEERHPPLELPSQVGLHYFRLLRDDSKRMWDLIVQEKELAIRWVGSEGSDFEIKLYMTVPGGDTQS